MGGRDGGPVESPLSDVSAVTNRASEYEFASVFTSHIGFYNKRSLKHLPRGGFLLNKKTCMRRRFFYSRKDH